MMKLILYTNESELKLLEDFKNKKPNINMLSNTHSLFFTNDATKVKYYPIKVIMNIQDTRKINK